MAGPYAHGKDTVILMGTTNPPTTDLSADIFNSKLTRKRIKHENNGYGASAIGRQGGLYDLEFEFEIRINSTNHATLRTLQDSDTVYFYVRPFGTGSGKKQYLFSGFFEEVPMEAPSDDILERSVKVAVNGDWTESTQ